MTAEPSAAAMSGALSPLVDADTLAGWLRDHPDRVRVFDCGFDLADTEAGARAYAAAHLPGAVYLHLERDLSGPTRGPQGEFLGRHPLPDPVRLATTMAASGVDDDSVVVAYDAAGGIFASRLWWMLRWLGHARVAVLDGGIAAWRAAGQPCTDALTPPRPRAAFSVRAPLVPALRYAELREAMDSWLIVDARAADRFRGENETLDPIGGHIPGARHRFYRDNLGSDARFKPAAQLREEWLAVLGGRAPAQMVSQCGSGVTACHNLLALDLAGLGGASLYPGSWSEWCRRPDAPLAVGPADGETRVARPEDEAWRTS